MMASMASPLQVLVNTRPRLSAAKPATSILTSVSVTRGTSSSCRAGEGVQLGSSGGVYPLTYLLALWTRAGHRASNVPSAVLWTR